MLSSAHATLTGRLAAQGCKPSPQGPQPSSPDSLLLVAFAPGSLMTMWEVANSTQGRLLKVGGEGRRRVGWLGPSGWLPKASVGAHHPAY